MQPVHRLHCACGKTRVEIAGTPIVSSECYCNSCREAGARLQSLAGAPRLLDGNGGTRFVLYRKDRVRFVEGADAPKEFRLTPASKTRRVVASCCNTPLGNLVGTRIPFIGVVAQAFERPDDTVGAPIGRIYGKYARGTPPGGSARASLRVFARAIVMVLGWKVTGRTWPHPFFERGASVPRYPVRTLSTAEREALRPLCGPRPAQDAGVTVAPPGSLR